MAIGGGFGPRRHFQAPPPDKKDTLDARTSRFLHAAKRIGSRALGDGLLRAIALAAAIAGVTLNLALFFAGHAFWPQGLAGSIDACAAVGIAYGVIAG